MSYSLDSSYVPSEPPKESTNEGKSGYVSARNLINSETSYNTEESNSHVSVSYNTSESSYGTVNYDIPSLYNLNDNYAIDLSQSTTHRKSFLCENYRSDMNLNSSQSKLQAPAPSKPVLKTSSSFLVTNQDEGFNHDWNKILQDTLENFDTSSLPQLTNLVNSFVETAEIYAKIIISEWGLEDSQKTIKPADVGGVAGGRKYIVQGILFKIALDTKIYQETWMYGGKKPSNSKAMKAFGQEIKGVEYLIQSCVPELHYPLVAKIDFKGYRVIAISLLPINKDTLVFGSADAGRTVLGGTEVVARMMENVTTNLNLRPHKVSREVTMGTPGDIEVHLGSDGRFYTLDFARIFPPEAPSTDKEVRAADPRSVFYKLLRPEFVHKYKTPLNPDSFTQWNRFEDNKEQHEKDLIEATDYLKNTLIPQLGAELHSEFGAPKKEKPVSLKSSISESQKLACTILRKMHGKGINYRYLGFLRSTVRSNPTLCKLLLEIAVARVIKHKICGQMRAIMERVKIPADEPFKMVIVDYLNFLFADDVDSKQYWAQTIKKSLSWRFENILNYTEFDSNFCIRSVINVPFVVQYCLESLNVTIRSSPWENFLTHPTDFKWLATDIDRLGSKTSFTFQSYFYDGTSRFLESRINKYEDISIRLLNDSVEILTLCSFKMFNCPITHWMLGNTYSELGRLTADINQATTFYEKAYEHYQTATNISHCAFKASATNHVGTLLDHATKYQQAGKKSLAKTKRAEALEKYNESQKIPPSASFLDVIGGFFTKEVNFQSTECSKNCLMSRILRFAKVKKEEKFSTCVEGRCQQAFESHKKAFI